MEFPFHMQLPVLGQKERKMTEAELSPREGRVSAGFPGQAGSQRTGRLDQPCRCISSLPPLPPRLLTSSCSPSHLHSPCPSSTEAQIHKPESFSPTQWTLSPIAPPAHVYIQLGELSRCNHSELQSLRKGLGGTKLSITSHVSQPSPGTRGERLCPT